MEWKVKTYFHLLVFRLDSSRTYKFLSKILLDVCVPNQVLIRF